MWEWVAAIWALISVVLAAVIYFQKKQLLGIVQAIEDEKSLLYEDSNILYSDVLKRLTLRVSDLIRSYQKAKNDASDYVRQIEMTLGQLQDVVLIVAADHSVLYANKAARVFLGLKDEHSEGVKVESIVKEGQLLDYIYRILNGEVAEQVSLSFDRVNEETCHFEILGLQLRVNNADEDEPASSPAFFVMHDITKLKQLENMRREFVANVSHELRTPVTVIKGFSDTLLRDYQKLSDAELEKFLSKIHRNVERFHLLLEDLLELSRLESGKAALNLQLVSLREMVAEVVEPFNESASLHRSAVRIVVDLDPLEWMVDEIKIAQVINNLIDNALQYAIGLSEIRISSRRQGKVLWVDVCDNGCGIPPKDMPHLFERFYRVDKGRSRDSGGTGLGLSIVKHIVRMHGGEVTASSQEGEGARFSFSIPAH